MNSINFSNLQPKQSESFSLLSKLKDFQKEILSSHNQFIKEINKLEEDLNKYEEKNPYKIHQKPIETLTAKNSPHDQLNNSSSSSEEKIPFGIRLDSHMLYKSKKEIEETCEKQKQINKKNISPTIERKISIEDLSDTTK